MNHQNPFFRQCFPVDNNPLPSNGKCQNCGCQDTLELLQIDNMTMWVCTKDENDIFPCFESAWEFMSSYQSPPNKPQVKRVIYETD